jgi:cytochrome c
MRPMAAARRTSAHPDGPHPKRKLKTSAAGAASLLAAAVAAACGGSTGAKAPPTAPKAAFAPGEGCKAASAAKPLSKPGQSATVALAKVKGRRVAFVADEDAKAILTIDLDARTELAQTPLEATPAQLLVADDGRVFVSLRDKSELAVFSASSADAPLAKLCAAPTPAEPIAIAPTPDGSTLVVTAGWGQKLAAFDASTLAPKFEAKTAREPRSVVVADDGKTAFVSHAVGSIMSAIDLAGDKHEVSSISMRGFDSSQLEAMKRQKNFLRQLKNGAAPKTGPGQPVFPFPEEESKNSLPSCQGFALAKSAEVPGRIFAPQVLVEPGDPDRRPSGYGDENSQTELPAVAVVDEGARTPLASSVLFGRDLSLLRKGMRPGPRSEQPECLLPRAAAVDAQTKSLLVTCYGIDAVVAYDATAANPLRAERRRWTVGAGPSGVAVDPEKHLAAVWSQFDRTFSTFPIGGGELVDEKAGPPAVRKTALAAPARAPAPDYVLGRILFHAAGDARIASDGRACASCHPDGRDDAITWATPDGPRRSIMLAGRATTSAPYSWNGTETSLHNHLGNTFDRLNGGGLRSVELDALVAYVSKMPAPPAAAPESRAKVERGRAIFASSETGCASCHAGAAFTDGKNHDVGSKHHADRAAEFNTPSLHLVGGGGPYFHDGRYATLAELLKKSDGQMGRTEHLSDADLEALEAYLKTL